MQDGKVAARVAKRLEAIREQWRSVDALLLKKYSKVDGFGSAYETIAREERQSTDRMLCDTIDGILLKGAADGLSDTMHDRVMDFLYALRRDVRDPRCSWDDPEGHREDAYGVLHAKLLSESQRMDRERRRATQAEDRSNAESKSGAGNENWQAKALAYIIANPKAKGDEIASHVGKTRTQLYRDPQVKAALKARPGKLRTTTDVDPDRVQPSE